VIEQKELGVTIPSREVTPDQVVQTSPGVLTATDVVRMQEGREIIDVSPSHTCRLCGADAASPCAARIDGCPRWNPGGADATS